MSSISGMGSGSTPPPFPSTSLITPTTPKKKGTGRSFIRTPTSATSPASIYALATGMKPKFSSTSLDPKKIAEGLTESQKLHDMDMKDLLSLPSMQHVKMKERAIYEDEKIDPTTRKNIDAERITGEVREKWRNNYHDYYRNVREVNEALKEIEDEGKEWKDETELLHSSFSHKMMRRIFEKPKQYFQAVKNYLDTATDDRTRTFIDTKYHDDPDDLFNFRDDSEFKKNPKQFLENYFLPLIKLFQDSGNIPKLQQVILNVGDLPNVGISETDINLLTQRETLYNHNPAIIIRMILDLKSPKAKPNVKLLKQIQQNFDVDIRAFETNQITRQTLDNKINAYMQDIEQNVDAEDLNAITHKISTGSAVTMSFLLEQLNYVEEAIKKDPHSAISKKIKAINKSIIDQLKAGTIDIDSAWDKLNQTLQIYSSTIYTKFSEPEVKPLSVIEYNTSTDSNDNRLRSNGLWAFHSWTRKVPLTFRSNVLYRATPKDAIETLKDPITTTKNSVNFMNDPGIWNISGTNVAWISDILQQKWFSRPIVTSSSIKHARDASKPEETGGSILLSTLTKDKIKTVGDLKEAAAALAFLDFDNCPLQVGNTPDYFENAYPVIHLFRDAWIDRTGVNPRNYATTEAKISPYNRLKTYFPTDVKQIDEILDDKDNLLELQNEVNDLINFISQVNRFTSSTTVDPIGRGVPIEEVYAKFKLPNIGRRRTKLPSKVQKVKKVKWVQLSEKHPFKPPDTEDERRKSQERERENVQYSRLIEKSEPEIGKFRHRNGAVEYIIRNADDLTRMKSDITGQGGKLYIINLKNGRLFPVSINDAIIGLNYVWIPDNLKENAKTVAFYPTAMNIARDDENSHNYKFIKGNGDKGHKLLHRLPGHIEHKATYKTQRRKAVGGSLWSIVKKKYEKAKSNVNDVSRSINNSMVGKYIQKNTVGAVQNLIDNSRYEYKNYIEQSNKNLNKIIQANQALYRNPSLGNLRNAINITTGNGIKYLTQPIISAAREGAAVSQFAGEMPGMNIAKAVTEYSLPPLKVVDALMNVVKASGVGSDQKMNMKDAAFNLGDAIISSGGLSGDGETVAKLINTSAKVADYIK